MKEKCAVIRELLLCQIYEILEIQHSIERINAVFMKFVNVSDLMPSKSVCQTLEYFYQYISLN